MEEQKKSRKNLWLELARIAIAILSGLLGGGGAQILM